MTTILKDTKRKLPALIISLSLVAFFGIGCSLDSTGVGPNTESQTTETATYNNSTVPDIELPAGLELISLNGRALPHDHGNFDDPPEGGDNGNPPDDPGMPFELCSSGWVTVADGGTVTHEYSGCAIEPGEMPYDEEITVCLPHPGYAIVDFGPHPLYFNGEVDIWFDLSNANVPPQRYNMLEMWYVNDNNELEPVPLHIDRHNMLAIGETTHFSRYILTVRTLIK